MVDHHPPRRCLHHHLPLPHQLFLWMLRHLFLFQHHRCLLLRSLLSLLSVSRSALWTEPLDLGLSYHLDLLQLHQFFSFFSTNLINRIKRTQRAIFKKRNTFIPRKPFTPLIAPAPVVV